MVGIDPHGAGTDMDGWQRTCAWPGALRDKRIHQLNRIHAPGPQKQRVRGVGGAEVAVTAATDRQPYAVPACPGDGGRDVLGTLGREHPRAGGGGPCAVIRASLGKARLVAHVELVANMGQRFFPGGRVQQRVLRNRQAAPDLAAQGFPVGIGGPAGGTAFQPAAVASDECVHFGGERQEGQGEGGFQHSATIHGYPP